MNREINKKLLLFVLIIFALEGIFFFIGDFKYNQAIRSEEKKLEILKNTLANVPVLAKAFSVYDITEQKEIYNKNGDLQLPLASLAKTMTALIVFKNYKLDDEINISQISIEQEGDNGLFVNEKWKVADLIKFTLVASSNDGAVALSQDDENFIEKMNDQAQKIGMNSTVFLNATGLDFDEELSGVYSSARDANIMAIYALQNYPEVFNITTLAEVNLKSESGFEHNIKNTNIIVDKIPNILFSKTGLTSLAGGNLTIIFVNKEGHEIAITVLGSTIDGRFSDMEKLVNVL
ncbi:MAG: serine hydrolase [Candidatus Paceibacterota bacterium]|jgi:D-alanyl-D-alanine carboxypeptidase (penicillin-binding protein 5/6)